MAKQDTNTELKKDEFSKIFDDYRAKIEEITRRTEKNLHSIDIKSGENNADEDEQIEVITAPPRPEVSVNSAIQAQLENVLLQNAEPASKPEVIKSDVETKPKTMPPPQTEPAFKPEVIKSAGEIIAAVTLPLKTELPLKPEVVKSAGEIKAEITLPSRKELPLKPEIVNSVVEKKAEITPPPQRKPYQKPEVGNTRVEGGHPVFEESAEILAEARREAKQIIDEAEESAKKEARKRTQSQVDKFIEKAKKEAEEIIARANKSAAEIIAGTTPPPRTGPSLKPETLDSRAEGGRPAIEESAEILAEARREAKQIIDEAEESAKKEARKRTQSQVDKFIEKAKKEAEEIIARANKSAEKVMDDVIIESKREADLIIRETTEKYRLETEAKSSRAIAEAQENAGKMLEDVSASAAQVGQHLTEIVDKAKQTISFLETTLQAEITELTGIIAETQDKLESATKTTIKEEKNMPPLKQSSETKTNPTHNPTLAIRLIGEKSSGKNGNSVLFSGQMEMKSASASFDYQYLKKLKKYLVHIPKIKYLQEYASEKEMSVVFDILEPLPLLDILSNIPMVDEVITRADDDICLVFKTTGE